VELPSFERIRPLHSRKTSEVGIVGVHHSPVVDRQRCNLGIGREIARRADCALALDGAELVGALNAAE
jgi:hypothetical protein